MESYRTEEEQVQELKRWWDENGRSAIAAVVIALAAGFGWQGWQGYQSTQAEGASDLYQALIRARTSDEAVDEQRKESVLLGEQLKSEHAGTTYAQFAALHLAALAVENEDPAEAEAQLRWVLGRANKGSDTARVAQLRLARIVADRGDVDQALAILAEGDADSYQASYAMARGDILFAAGRGEEARQAYVEAQSLAALSGQQMSILQAKLQRLTPLPPRNTASGAVEETVPAESSSSTQAADAVLPDESIGDDASGAASQAAEGAE